MSQEGTQFSFEISNANIDTSNKLDDKHSGVGLENIKNNLNLVYPNAHQFEVIETKNQFKVRLTIQHDRA